MPRVINGSALRQIRELTGLSGRELGRRAGIYENGVTNIELGKRPASPAVARKLADALGVPLDAITHIVPDAEREPEGSAA